MMLDDPIFVKRLHDWLVTMRKKNAAVMMLTQTPTHLTQSKVGQIIAESVVTQLLYPNPRANPEDYRILRLNEKEAEFLCTPTGGLRLALLRSAGDFGLRQHGPRRPRASPAGARRRAHRRGPRALRLAPDPRILEGHAMTTPPAANPWPPSWSRAACRLHRRRDRRGLALPRQVSGAGQILRHAQGRRRLDRRRQHDERAQASCAD